MTLLLRFVAKVSVANSTCSKKACTPEKPPRGFPYSPGEYGKPRGGFSYSSGEYGKPRGGFPYSPGEYGFSEPSVGLLSSASASLKLV